MSSDHEAEIRASVGAHHELGSEYDDALAEGLVERIGEEIDRRIDARLGQFGPGLGPQWGMADQAAEYQTPPPGYQVPPAYQALPAYQAPPSYYQAPPPPAPGPIPAWPAHRSVAATFIALGSMAMGVGATAVVSHATSTTAGAQTVMVLLIWTAIAVINVAYARRR